MTGRPPASWALTSTRYSPAANGGRSVELIAFYLVRRRVGRRDRRHGDFLFQDIGEDLFVVETNRLARSLHADGLPIHPLQIQLGVDSFRPGLAVCRNATTSNAGAVPARNTSAAWRSPR